ncbi:ABC transporter permease, partial [Yersinia pestis]
MTSRQYYIKDKVMGSIVKEVDDVRQVSLMKRTALFLL